MGSALLVGPFAELPWPVEPKRAHAQQVSQLQIKVVPNIVARAQSQVVLPIEVGPAEALPNKCFVSLRGLPPSVTLTEGHQITAGSWAVSVAGLSTLKAYIPVGYSGRADIDIKLIAFDGRMLAQTRTTLVVEPSVPPRASGATREKGKGPAPASQPTHNERALGFIKKAEELMATGNVDSARLFYERAADAGLAQGALALAATFDPHELARRQIVGGLRPDPAQAQRWYERARELGAVEAEEPLRRLSAHQ
jgi:hypothetical protein